MFKVDEKKEKAKEQIRKLDLPINLIYLLTATVDSYKEQLNEFSKPITRPE